MRGDLEVLGGNNLVTGWVLCSYDHRTSNRNNVNIRLTSKVVILIDTVGLIGWGSILGYSEWSTYQQQREAKRVKGAIQAELVTALEDINTAWGGAEVA